MTTSPEYNFEAQMELRRRLMRHLIANWNEDLVHTATDGFQDLLSDAHDELLEELLKPLFELSDFWPHRMAAEVLGLDVDEEYNCRDLLSLFEGRTEGPDSGDGATETNWKEDGF